MKSRHFGRNAQNRKDRISVLSVPIKKADNRSDDKIECQITAIKQCDDSDHDDQKQNGLGDFLCSADQKQNKHDTEDAIGRNQFCDKICDIGCMVHKKPPFNG